MAIDARQLQADGRYQAHAPLATLLDDLGQIKKLLQEILAGRKMIRRVAGIAALAGLLSAVAAGATGSAVLGFGSFFGFTLALILFVYSFIYGRALVKHQDRLGLIEDLSKIFPQDAGKGSKFSATLVLKPAPTLIREEEWIEKTNGKQKFFEEEFLSLEGELLDGTVLNETVEELTRKRTYKNPRGKFKTKLRTRYLITLRLAYPSDLYGDARAAYQTLHEEIRVPQSATLRDLRVTEKAIVVKALVNVRQGIVQTSAMLSMGAYRILNLARRLAAGKPGDAA
jgi:hypothetical protein